MNAKKFYIVVIIMSFVFSSCNSDILPIKSEISNYEVITYDEKLKIEFINIPTSEDFSVKIKVEYSDEEGNKFLSRNKSHLEIKNGENWYILQPDYDLFKEKNIPVSDYIDYMWPLSEYVEDSMDHYGTALISGTYRFVIYLENENNPNDVIFVGAIFKLNNKVIAK